MSSTFIQQITIPLSYMHQSTRNGDLEYSIGLPGLLHVPTEVCENIIDMLYSGNSSHTLQDIATLQSCALVCRDWRIRSQRVLFYKVQLYDSVALHRLSMILDAGQHLRDYVHEIVFTGHYLHTTASIFALFPAVFARKLPNLESIHVGQLQDCDTWWYPRRSDPPKAKSLPYIPLHLCFPHFLSCFTGVHILLLYSTTFHSFNELAQMLHGLPNLETLVCNSVRWIKSGVSHVGGGFAKQHDWAVGQRCPLPPFAPRLRRLWLKDISMDGANRLVSTRGPHLTWLGMTIPLEVHLEEAVDEPEGEIDLSTCSRLGTLYLAITPEFSGVQLKSILTSWKPRHVKPFLVLQAYGHSRFTRQEFADVLSSVGAITDAWLRMVEALSSPEGSENVDSHGVQYQLMVEIYDWEAERKWWLNYVASFFPTWLQLGRLHMDFATPPNRNWEWKEDAEEHFSQSTTAPQCPLSEDVDLSPSSTSKPHI